MAKKRGDFFLALLLTELFAVVTLNQIADLGTIAFTMKEKSWKERAYG